jgi:hypothetical protein
MREIKTLRRHDVMTPKRRDVRCGQPDRGLASAFLSLLLGLAMAVYQVLILVCRLVGWLAWAGVELLDDANAAMARSTAARSDRVMRAPGAEPAGTVTYAVVATEQGRAA